MPVTRVQSKPADVDVEAVTAAVEQELDAQEWNMQEIERQQQAQARIPGWALLPAAFPPASSVQHLPAASAWSADHERLSFRGHDFMAGCIRHADSPTSMHRGGSNLYRVIWLPA